MIKNLKEKTETPKKDERDFFHAVSSLRETLSTTLWLLLTQVMSRHVILYYFAFQQSTWSQIVRHSYLSQAEVQNQVRTARLQSCWTHCMEQSSTPPRSY